MRKDLGHDRILSRNSRRERERRASGLRFIEEPAYGPGG
jgi:hypothetical protein